MLLPFIFANLNYTLTIDDLELLTAFQILGQLRIVGENKYVETANDRGLLSKLVADWLGCSQEEVEEFCFDTIEQVVKKSKNFGVIVSKKFSGAYFLD